jgi:SAM-dependent methyltransferase
MSALVAEGYDRIADRFAAWAAGIPDLRPALARLERHVACDAEVLERGCGAGPNETRRLAKRYRLTAVDVSLEQLRRARRNAPGAAYVRADLAGLGLGPASFDWIAAWLATTMVLSGFAAETNASLLREAGFELLHDEIVAVREPEGDIPLQWVRARRAGSGRVRFGHGRCLAPSQECDNSSTGPSGR